MPETAEDWKALAGEAAHDLGVLLGACQELLDTLDRLHANKRLSKLATRYLNDSGARARTAMVDIATKWQVKDYVA